MHLIFIFLLLSGALLADSKFELQQAATITDLRARLAASDAAKADHEKKDKASLSNRIDLYEGRRQASSTAATEARVVASTDASTNASNASIAAQVNAEIAKRATEVATQAALQAATAAGAAHAQNIALMITQLFGFGSLIAGFIYKIYTDQRDHLWAMQATEIHRHAVLTKIDEVKTEAHAAYEVANTVNDKILSIGLQVKDGTPLEPEHI